jgi:hypothetical protein
MIQAATIACLWSAVGASVYFWPTSIGRRQRLARAIGTAVVFWAVGFVDVSSILHSIQAGSAVTADSRKGVAG